ncbi:MAG: hypothetical protein E7508_03040 [Ruminococcus sp.]|nr:hypothetical protein [Ruminococcus sp.]
MDDKKQPGILETVRQINNREELEKQERFEKKNNLQREKYGEKLAEEKKELLKVKQGVIEESEMLASENDAVVKYTFFGKVKNFIYHNKWWLGIATFIFLIAAFLIYDTLTTVRSDVRVMLLCDADEIQGRSENIFEFFNENVVDYNDDGRQYTDIVIIPISHNMEENISSAVGYENSLTNLSTQFQLAECMIIIADSAVDELIEPETTLENLEEYFPDCPYVDGVKLYLKDTRFAEIIGCDKEDIPDDLFLAVRKPATNLSSEETNQTNYENAMETLKSVIKDLD